MRKTTGIDAYRAQVQSLLHVSRRDPPAQAAQNVAGQLLLNQVVLGSNRGGGSGAPKPPKKPDHCLLCDIVIGTVIGVAITFVLIKALKFFHII